MIQHTGDRLKGVFTMNEFFCFLDKAYGADPNEAFAPGKRATAKQLNQARHNALLGHGLAVQAMRAERSNCPPVGMADNPHSCVPILETPADIEATKKAFRDKATFLTPMMEGAYLPSYLEQAGASAPNFTDAEMKTIGSPVDFVGVNVYSPTYIRHAPEEPAGWEHIPCGDAYPKMHMPWLNIGPQVLYWTPRIVSELWKPKAIYITENGCPYPDKLTEKNEIWDLGRVMYLQQHLIAGHRAVAEGVPLKGYFLWTLMDNFEWCFGNTKRVGICYTNYRTQERIPKLSGRFYSQVARTNCLGV